MIVLKNERDIEAMRAAGAVAAEVLHLLGSWIKPGVTTREIDNYAAQLIKERGAKSAFLTSLFGPLTICAPPTANLSRPLRSIDNLDTVRSMCPYPGS